MRVRIALAVGLLLTSLSPACSPVDRVASAQAQSKPAVKQDARPLREGWRIAAPVTLDKLTVFPVVSDEAAAAEDFITLDEGLRVGSVQITELGGARPGRDDSAEVNRLALINKSGKPLVLIAGEMIVGGKQDRIVGHDCVIASGNTPVPLDVFCVEQGRWSGELAFGRSNAGRSTQSSRGGRGSNQGGGDTDIVFTTRSGGDAPNPPSKGMAPPNVRAIAQAEKNQSEVWREVDNTRKDNNVATPTGDLKSVYTSEAVNNKLDRYEKGVEGKLSDKNIVGVVVAVSGRIIAADVFASPRLFRAYWPKMLHSYALQAQSAPKVEKRELSAADAEAFLARVEGAASSDGKKGVYSLRERQSDKAASFELEYGAEAAPLLVHFNRVAKK